MGYEIPTRTSFPIERKKMSTRTTPCMKDSTNYEHSIGAESSKHPETFEP
jgi:hypothetical protein